MTQQTMYPAVVNSPPTELASDITASATSITIVNATVLPPAPNLLTIGIDETAETVRYTALSGNTLTVVRAFQGVAKAWSAGTKVARYYTAYDHDAFVANISDVLTELGTKETPSGAQAKANTAQTNAINASIPRTTQLLTQTDLNSLKTNGFYEGSNLTNAPNGDSNWWRLIVITHSYDPTNYVTQIAFKFDSQNMFVRYLAGGAWSQWSYSIDSRGGTIFGGVTIASNGGGLALVGNTDSYMGFYPRGIDAGRSGYFGFGNPANNALTIANEKVDGDIYFMALGQLTSISDLKYSVSNGKALIAAAITGKGKPTAANSSFELMASNINQIATGKKYASVQVTFNSTDINPSVSATIPTLGFTPSYYVIRRLVINTWDGGSGSSLPTGSQVDVSNGTGVYLQVGGNTKTISLSISGNSLMLNVSSGRISINTATYNVFFYE